MANNRGFGAQVVGQRYDRLLCQVHFDATDYPTGTKDMAKRKKFVAPHDAGATNSVGRSRFAQLF
jgi:hypothetical protein